MAIEDVVNNKDLENIKAFAFELACQEADYLGIEKQGEIFDQMCKTRTDILVGDINKIFDISLSNGLFYVDVYIPEISQIPYIVEHLYQNE